MRKVKVFGALVFSLVFIFVANPIVEVQAAERTDIVYVTKTGEKYHSDGCQYLKKSKIEISLGDAVDKGYEPCSKCHPPKLEK